MNINDQSLCIITILVLFFITIQGNQDLLASDETQYFFRGSRNETKLCRYRDWGIYPSALWQVLTVGGCYIYAFPSWFNVQLPFGRVLYSYQGISYALPYVTINDTKYLFNLQDEKVAKAIKQSFTTRNYYNKWKECTVEAVKCCENHMNEENIYPSEEYPCPTIWDAWSCFKSAKPNSISELPCPSYSTSAEDWPCTLYSSKLCFTNGTWNQKSDYTTCTTTSIYKGRHNFHVIILAISTAICLPALIIYLSYRSLRNTRIILHRNLLLACIIRNILTIMTKSIIILDTLKPVNESKDIMKNNSVLCRILAFFETTSVNFIYACMLVDGYYLHRLIIDVFSQDLNIYLLYGVVTGLTLIPAFIWASVMAIYANDSCWLVSTSWYQWTVDSVRVGILCVNALMLANIIRVLLWKLRLDDKPQHTRSTFRAMLFLIPLFGVPILLTAFPGMADKSSCLSTDAYYYSNYIIQALQGIMVATLFCYCSPEVHVQLKGSYRRLRISIQERYDRYSQSTLNRRRTTAATYVGDEDTTDSISSKANMHPQQSDKKVQNWLDCYHATKR